MPELPEVESIRRSLRPHLLGHAPLRADLFRPDILHGPASPLDLLAGAVITDLQRHGKQMALIAEGPRRVLLVHLGMSGRLTWTPAAPHTLTETVNPSPSHLHARWVFPHGRLLFIDPRRFGGLTTLALDALPQRWADLGPDALTITGDQLRQRAGHSRRAVKACLLDQRVVAGVGNIYADEALFEARINPRRNAHRMSRADWHRLADAVRAVLAVAVAQGGSTLRDYADADGRPGAFTRLHRVYARGGQPCPRCGGILRTLTLAQRTTTRCPRCQKR